MTPAQNTAAHILFAAILIVSIQAASHADTRVWAATSTDSYVRLTQVQILTGNKPMTWRPVGNVDFPIDGPVILDDLQFSPDKRLIAIGYSTKESRTTHYLLIGDVRRRSILKIAGPYRTGLSRFFLWTDNKTIVSIWNTYPNLATKQPDDRFVFLRADKWEESDATEVDMDRFLAMVDRLTFPSVRLIEAATTTVSERGYVHPGRIVTRSHSERWAGVFNGQLGDVAQDGNTIVCVIAKGRGREVIVLQRQGKKSAWIERSIPLYETTWLLRTDGRFIYIGITTPSKERQLIVGNLLDLDSRISIRCDDVVEPFLRGSTVQKEGAIR